MDAQQMTEELGQPTVQELLTAASLARLAYNGPDGLPRAIPIGFYWNGDEIVICTAVTSPKVEALSKRPDVGITIDIGDTPDTARALLVRGSASVEIVDGVPHEYIAGSSKDWAKKASPSSNSKSTRCTTRWRASASSHDGPGAMTSAPVDCRSSSRSWRTTPGSDGRVEASHISHQCCLDWRAVYCADSLE